MYVILAPNATIVMSEGLVLEIILSIFIFSNFVIAKVVSKVSLRLIVLDLNKIRPMDQSLMFALKGSRAEVWLPDVGICHSESPYVCP